MSAILAFLAANKKDVAYALAFLVLVWAGWYMRGVYDDHLKLAELEAAQQLVQELQRASDAQATAYEHDRAAAQTNLLTIKQQLKVSRAQNHTRSDCPVPSDGVRAINQ